MKIDDLVSFQAKKSLITSVLTVADKNGNIYELPNALNKSVIDNTAKVLTSLLNHIRDQRAAEHMKDLLENAVKEKTQEIPVITDTKEVPESDAVMPDIINDNTDSSGIESAAVMDTQSDAEMSSDAEKASSDDDTEVKLKFCEECGAKIINNKAKFCYECGHRLI